MSSFDEKFKRQKRRKDHIAKDLRTPKYRERAVPKKRAEDEEERRWRRFHNIEEHFLSEGYHPLDKDEEH